MGRTLQPNQVADAFVSVPGIVIEVDDTMPTSDIQMTTSYTRFFPWDSASFTFQAPVAGLYEFLLHGQWTTITSSTNFIVKLVFDEGTANEVTLGDNENWQQRINNYYAFPSYTGVVNLSAGSHTVTAYCKETSGGVYLQGDYSGKAWSLILRSVSGSGAGGVLAAEQVDTTSDYTDSTTNIVELTTLSLSATTVDEVVLVELGLHAYYPSGGTSHALYLYYRVNSGSWVGIQKVALTAGNGVVPVNVAFPLSVSAGNTTIDFAFQGSAAVERRIRPAEQGAAIRSSISRYRGGLVPVQNNGTTITSTPAALDFVGDNVSVTNVGGKAQIEYNGVADGVTVSPAALTSNYSHTGSGWEAVDNGGGDALEVQFSCAEGEVANAVSLLRIESTAGTNPGLAVRLNLDSGTEYYPLSGTSNFPAQTVPTSGFWMVPISIPLTGLSAGLHTISLEIWRNAAATIYAEGSTFWIQQFRGGYVKPENVPILEYSSASVVNVASAPGATDTLRMVMNDGVRYTATSPLTVDLTASGLGGLDTGSEASDTWYYVYAVPSATAGVCDVVASVTDPDSGGPTGYDAWRYLGAVRNNESGDIREFYNRGAEFFWEHPSEVIAGATGAPFAWTAYDMEALGVVPLTANIAQIHLRVETGSNSGTNRCDLDAGPVTASGPIHASVQAEVSEWDMDNAVGFVPITSTHELWVQFIRTVGTTDGWRQVRCLSYIDGHLRGAVEARAQAPYTPSNLWRYFTPTDLPTGAAAPEAVWRGDSLSDQTANGHDLTVTSGTAKYSAIEGLKGFWSTDSYYLSVGSPAAFRTTGAFTVEFLVSVGKSDSYFLRVAGSSGELETDNALILCNIDTTLQFRAFHEYGAGNNESLLFDAAPHFGPVQHIAFTRSSNGLTYKIYVDGVLLDTKVASNAPTGGSNANVSLMEQSGPAPNFDGVFLAGRFFLEEWSAAQVLESYQWARRLS